MSEIISLNGRICWLGGKGRPDLAAGHSIIAEQYEDTMTDPNQGLRPNKVPRTGPNKVSRPKKDLKIDLSHVLRHSGSPASPSAAICLTSKKVLYLFE